MNKINSKGIASVLAFSLILVLATIVLAPLVMAVPEKNYTLDTDFNEGVLANVEHDTIHDQLQLSKKIVSLPLIWVPNSDEGTVSKVDTQTGKELGRYFTGSTVWGSPSRTTVDLMGNVWFGNRGTGTVVKIGLFEAGQCKDKNGDGVIETSQDLNNDGDVVGAEILPWGTDECVLLEISGIGGARGIAIDSDNNLWAGDYWGSNEYKHIDGETGAILSTVSTGKSAYGAVIDANGILWSSEFSSNFVGRLDPLALSYTSSPINHFPYGLGIDAKNNLFVSGWTDDKLSKFDISGALPVLQWTKSGGLYGGRGVVVTSDGDIWVATSMQNAVVRLDNADGHIIATIPVGEHPTGVSVDNNGKVWVVNYGDGYIKRIDPTTNSIDLEKLILGNDGTGISHHYGYSDMTGYVARTITTKTGTWTVDFDSETAGTPWGTVSWNSVEPDGTIVSARVRSSDDKATWSAWEYATSGVKLTSTPAGRYLQIESTLQIKFGDISPILYDLTVKVDNQPPTAEAGGPYTVDEGSPISVDGSGSTDPDEDVLIYTWDLNNDGIYETPGVAVMITPPDGPATLIVGLEVSDGKGGVSTDTAIITVNNVAPTVKIADTYSTVVPMTLRIAGQGKVGNSVALEIIQDGAVVGSGKVTRVPGSPNDQEITISATVDLSKAYNGKLIFDTEEAISGGTPVWIKIDGVETKVNTFNTQKNDPDSYHQIYEFNLMGMVSLVGKEITFTASATDPGTDDMAFGWLFGDGGTLNTVYPWPNGHSVSESVKHTYSGTGTYTVSLNVVDDDGGVGTASKIITIS